MLYSTIHGSARSGAAEELLITSMFVLAALPIGFEVHGKAADGAPLRMVATGTLLERSSFAP